MISNEKILGFYILAAVFRIRGMLFRVLGLVVTCLCFYLFVRYGLPQIA